MATWTIYKKLNVSPNSFPLVIPIKQYSSDFALKFKLYSTEGDLDIEAGATTKIRGTKRDGNGFELTGTRIGNTCTFSGTKAQMQQMTAAHGRCVFEIVVEKNTKELITANFYLEVQRAAMDAGTVTSESIIEEFEDFQSKIAAAQAAATAAQAQADRAEAAAESIDFGLDASPTQGSSNAVSSGGVYVLKEDLNRSLIPYNSTDVVELAHPTGRTHYGVTYTWNGTVCTVTGTATQSSFYNIYNNESPDWMIGGNTYYVYFSATNVTLAVYEWHNGSIDSTPLINTKTDTEFTLSENVEAITIRIRVANNTTANESVHPIILTALPNKIIVDRSVLSRVYTKKMAIFGDSVLLGRNGDGTASDIVKKNIPYYIHLLTSYDVDNYAVGGMGWVSTRESQTIAYDIISTTDLTNYDTVLLCFGINDSHEALGEWNSTDETTIMGQVKKCISYIGTENPSANIILVAPFITKSGNFPSWSLETRRDNGWNMQMLSDRLEIFANFYHITFIDQQDSPMLGYGMSSLMGSDNSHPNAEGYKKLGYWLAYRLNTENKRDIKFENTIEQLSRYNSFDIIKNYRYENETRNGVTYICNTDGTFTVSGTATSDSFHRIVMAQNELPNWLEAGRSYYVKFSSGNVSLKIYEEINGTLSGSAISMQKDTVYKASESITGIQLRLFVSSGVTVNETISVSMLTGMPNELVDNPPMLTIIDDDANVKYYTQLLPLIERKGVPIVCALPAGKTYDDGVETHMSWEQIEDAYKRGAEFLNHSYSHWTYTKANTHTEQELWMDYAKAKNIIHSHGISGGDMLVYGGLSGTLTKAKQAATHMSKCAFHSHGDEINYRQTLDRWFIKRYGIEDAPYSYDISALKTLIDNCAQRGGWMIWMIHTSDGEWKESIVDVLSEAIDYALAKGVAVVGAECGYIHYVS